MIRRLAPLVRCRKRRDLKVCPASKRLGDDLFRAMWLDDVKRVRIAAVFGLAELRYVSARAKKAGLPLRGARFDPWGWKTRRAP